MEEGQRTESTAALLPWHELESYRSRFESAQAAFIEEPRQAVKHAESLVGEAMDRLMDSLKRRVNEIHNELGDGGDTERLRIAMRRYRDLLNGLGDRGRQAG
jgi:hypothetical protein